MIKKNKWMLLATSVVILLPIAAGLILWDRLPDQLAVHFYVDNEPDSWVSKPIAVFIPCFLLVIHWVGVLATALDKRQAGIHQKLLTVLFWICPLVSLLLGAVVYCYALGVKVEVAFWVSLLLGVIFVLTGNYLPKAGQNRVVGIRTSAAMSNPEVWGKTQRIGGWSLTLCGLGFILTSPLQNPWVAGTLLLVSILVPLVYSLVLGKKGKGNPSR